MRNVKVLFVGSVILMSASFAEKIPYGMAGCGLGNALIKSNSTGSQIASGILNNLFFPQGFAMTTGTSGCSEDVGSLSSVEKEVYISANYGSIAKEAAQGSGEHLNTLASLMGCDEKSQDTFAKFSQANYENLFGTDDADGLLNRYQTQMTSGANGKLSCKEIT